MAVMLAVLFATLPLDAFGHVVAGSLVTPADLVGAAIAMVTIERLVTGRYRLHPGREKSIVAFVMFLFLGTLSVILSDDAPQIVSKGLVQVGGVSIMLLACIAMMNEVAKRPVLFAGYIRLSVIVLALVSLVGIAQFVFANALGYPGILDFSFLNRWSGGNVWFNLGSVDGMVRANSILQEPSALGMVLGTAAGVALLRLGLAGGSYRETLQQLLPRWAAISVLAGFIVTLSLIDFFLLAVVAGSLWLVSRRITATAIATFSGATFLFVAITYTAIASNLPQLSEKLGATEAITSDNIQVKRAEDLSAIALAVNVAVMRANLLRDPLLGAGLGAHPVTYDRENPGLGRLPAEIVNVGMNKEDAASLLIRLLSESGILGTIAFIGGGVFAVTRARHFILVNIASGMRPNVFLSLAIGVTASTIGVGLACLARAPQYYAPWFWLPIALTASVPRVLARVDQNLRGVENGSAEA
jgi:hypothetical protein